MQLSELLKYFGRNILLWNKAPLNVLLDCIFISGGRSLAYLLTGISSVEIVCLPSVVRSQSQAVTTSKNVWKKRQPHQIQCLIAFLNLQIAWKSSSVPIVLWVIILAWVPKTDSSYCAPWGSLGEEGTSYKTHTTSAEWWHVQGKAKEEGEMINFKKEVFNFEKNKKYLCWPGGNGLKKKRAGCFFVQPSCGIMWE